MGTYVKELYNACPFLKLLNLYPGSKEKNEQQLGHMLTLSKISNLVFVAARYITLLRNT